MHIAVNEILRATALFFASLSLESIASFPFSSSVLLIPAVVTLNETPTVPLFSNAASTAALLAAVIPLSFSKAPVRSVLIACIDSVSNVAAPTLSPGLVSFTTSAFFTVPDIFIFVSAVNWLTDAL